MRNGGAACTAANRFYVERTVADEFTRRLASAIAQVRIGAGTGPASARADDRAAPGRRGSRRSSRTPSRAARAWSSPAGRSRGGGHFFAPVVLCDVPDDARVMREEIFGPVVAIAAFDSEDEVLALANSATPAWLHMCTRTDLARAMRLGGGDRGRHGRRSTGAA